MSEPPVRQSSADDEFWDLVDARERLKSERSALCHADGRPRGFAVLSWESPARRRVSLLTAEISSTDKRFEQARARYAASMRVRVAGDVAAMRETVPAQAIAAAARPVAEFAALRTQVHASAGMKTDAAALRALEQKMQSESRGKR
ncbi:MAG: hypothetical protein JNL06_03640 [Alphaproteobacteria bacterium]|nr:hypothetical protein [Alphaproteobacteria bacterium]